MATCNSLSRREFLRLSALAIGAGLVDPRLLGILPPAVDQPSPIAIGRVAVPAIYIYSGPSFQSERLGIRSQDELLSLLEEVESPDGPRHNPLWYRIPEGYVHSGRIQRILPHPIYPPPKAIPKTGLFGEVTVPYTRSYRFLRSAGWQPLYRLYYQSVHWITGLDEGPDGQPWYRLRDTLLTSVEYHIPVSTLRPIPFEEFSPIAWHVPPEEKKIVISIEEQTLTAYQGEKEVLRAPVSTGIHSETVEEGELPTDTPTGSFHIQFKAPSRHMGDGNLTDDIQAYELPGVPWTMVFHETGVALHGTYWHSNFGARMSHGCINLRNEDAKWLFRWTTPAYSTSDWYIMGMGTLVQVV